MNYFKAYGVCAAVSLCFWSVPVAAQLEDARGTTASQAVQFLADQGLEGYQDGTFKPDQEIECAEFLKLVLEAAGKEVEDCENGTGYTDVNLSDWWSGIVCTATDLGIVEGYPDVTFKPAANINLAEVSKFAAKVNELETEVTDSTAGINNSSELCSITKLLPSLCKLWNKKSLAAKWRKWCGGFQQGTK